MGSDNAIREQMRQIGSIKKISRLTGYSYSYIHQVMNGHLRPGKPLKKKVNRLYVNLYKPGGNKPTVTIRYDNQEQQKRHLKLTNRERQEALEKFLKEKRDG